MSSATTVALTIILTSLLLFFYRGAPFLIFSKHEPPAALKFVEKCIPPLIIATLIVYCLKDIDYAARPYGAPHFIAIAAMDLFYWTLGAIIGGVAGSLINFSFEGVDFALTALFCVILTEQILASKDFLPPAIGIASSVAAAVLERVGILPQGNMLLLSLSVGITALALAKNLSKPKTAGDGK